MTEIAPINGLPRREDAIDPQRIAALLQKIDRIDTFGQDLGFKTQHEINAINAAHERAAKENEARRLGHIGVQAP